MMNYIGILRCFKCCYYHFARDCKKEVACGQCAGMLLRNVRKKLKKCVNCEAKIRSFRIKNIDSGHSAFHAVSVHNTKENLMNRRTE